MTPNNTGNAQDFAGNFLGMMLEKMADNANVNSTSLPMEFMRDVVFLSPQYLTKKESECKAIEKRRFIRKSQHIHGSIQKLKKRR